MPIEAPWLTAARNSIGQYEDGPDVPKLASEVAKAFPDVSGLSSYCALARNETAWCGIFCAAILSRFGIQPPFDRSNELRSFMWVDSWLTFGEKVAVGQQQPGDLALWLSSPHHISFVAGGGKYIGGNQGNAVTEGSYRTPDAIRRPVAVSVRPVSDRFSVCLPRVLEHEGGNDDDPRDPGGRTSRGITAERWAEWRQTHPGMPEDVWDAPQSAVEAIYREKYWNVLWCEQLPPGVDYAVFDFGVNSGPARSARFLQEIVGSEADGEVGPNTVAATRAADPEAVIKQLCDDRMAFLKTARNKETGELLWPTYGRGWTNRVNDVRRDAIEDVGATPQPEPEQMPANTLKELLAQLDTERKAIMARLDAAAAIIKKAQELANKPPPVPEQKPGVDLIGMIPEGLVPVMWPLIQKMTAEQVIALLRSLKSQKPAGLNAGTAALAGAGGGMGFAVFAIELLTKLMGGG